MTFPIDDVRAEFPALAVTDKGVSRVYFDAPGGTQACRRTIEAMATHLIGGTANSGGAFVTSRGTDATADAAHQAMADLIGGHPDEIAFGPNMTTLTLALSRALARDWGAGDELVLTRLDHDANVMPWLAVAADKGMTVRWLGFDPENGQLKLQDLPGLLSERTRLVAVGGASNALGTLNDIAAISAIVRENSSALIHVDAVQLVPHVPVDVEALDCDFLACSPYKFFGPHLGATWGRRELWQRLEAYKVRPAPIDPPAHRLETGTPSFEAMAGVVGLAEYLAGLGERLGAAPHSTRRDKLLIAMAGCADYERELGQYLLDGLGRMNSVRLYGPPTMEGRVPTFAFTLEGHHPDAVAAHLAERNIFAWSGHFYAVEVIAALGLESAGGLVRIGLCHYSTREEIDRLLAALAELE